MYLLIAAAGKLGLGGIYKYRWVNKNTQTCQSRYLVCSSDYERRIGRDSIYMSEQKHTNLLSTSSSEFMQQRLGEKDW